VVTLYFFLWRTRTSAPHISFRALFRLTGYPRQCFYEWQKKFSSHDKCMAHLAKLRWQNGFQCPQCGHDHGYWSGKHDRYECASCHRHTSVTSGTLFHATKLPLTKWFWAIYWVGTDKGGISALRLSKLIGVTWRSAYRILRKLRTAMGNRDSIYRLSEIVEPKANY